MKNNGDSFNGEFDQAGRPSADTSPPSPVVTPSSSSRVRTSTLGSRPQRSKGKSVSSSYSVSSEARRRQAREDLQSHVVASLNGAASLECRPTARPVVVNGSTSQYVPSPTRDSSLESGLNGSLPPHQHSSAPSPAHTPPPAPVQHDAQDWVREAPDNLSNSSSPSHSYHVPVHAAHPPRSPEPSDAVAALPRAHSDVGTVDGFAESHRHPSGDGSVWHRHQRNSAGVRQLPVQNREPIHAAFPTEHTALAHPIGPLPGELEVARTSSSRFARATVPPDRTTSETVRDHVNSCADQQLQYLMDGPFDEDLKVKLVNVCPAKLSLCLTRWVVRSALRHVQQGLSDTGSSTQHTTPFSLFVCAVLLINVSVGTDERYVSLRL